LNSRALRVDIVANPSHDMAAFGPSSQEDAQTPQAPYGLHRRCYLRSPSPPLFTPRWQANQARQRHGKGRRDQAHRDQAPRELRSRERKAGRRLRDCLDVERLWPGHPGCRQPHGLCRMQVCHSPKPPNAVIEDCACNCLSLPQQCVTFI
jgi:hypothetical protein